MSWEAVTWASKQRMKLPHEQLILLVLANCADPNGEAFSKWPGREHWWKYLADRTRLSKSSLFRHINTLIELGLCTRSMMVLEDGTRRPTIKLDLEAAFDIEDSEQHHSQSGDQSHGETGDDESAEEAAYACDINELQDDETAPEIQSHGETSPTGGTEPFPLLGMQEGSLELSKESPPTPQAGGHAPDDGFEEFRKAWARPIERLSVAKTAWEHVPTAKRGEVITAARGYWAWLGRQTTKPPPPVSAQTFLREASGWAQWLPYSPNAEGVSVGLVNSHPLDSQNGKALVVLHEIAGLNQYLRSIMIRNGAVNYLRPVTPRLAALAQAPKSSEWVWLERQQAAAWESFLREAVAVQVRQHLREGSRAPWPWPPSAEGKIYATGPPESLMTEQDIADFK